MKVVLISNSSFSRFIFFARLVLRYFTFNSIIRLTYMYLATYGHVFMDVATRLVFNYCTKTSGCLVQVLNVYVIHYNEDTIRKSSYFFVSNCTSVQQNFYFCLGINTVEHETTAFR